MPFWILLAAVLSADEPAPPGAGKGGIVAGTATEEGAGKDHSEAILHGLEIFKTAVRPLLRDRCLRCHGGEAARSDLDLSSRQGLIRGGKNGAAITPGSARKSLLLRRIDGSGEPRMPFQQAPLEPAEIARIASWIDLGAPYDAPLIEGKDDPAGWKNNQIPESARGWWAFRPLHAGALPEVRSPSWCRTPADRFILGRLEDRGMAPAAAAGRRRLIRRAAFDLTGMPPSPEEVEVFAGDESPEAYSRLLDRLLADPRHGETWGKRWLDLARFAESHGFEHDYDRPSAYHFRDFVIEAFNRDLPFDDFVRWQIAGDELEPDSNLALEATGFLAAGVHSTQITKNEVERHRYDEMDDMLATIGTSMLGLSIGCARCHDHKYDPIPQGDYYRLLSVFTSTVRSEVDMDMDPQGYLRARERFEGEHAPYLDALSRFEKEKIPGRFQEWERSQPAGGAPARWLILEPSSLKSSAGTAFSALEDGSFLAGGENPPFDEYTAAAPVHLRRISAVRLEALSHPSFVKGGPGRAGNGNFALSDFKVAAAGGGGPAVPLKLRNARATFQQSGLPVAAAIDGDRKSAWAVDPEFGKDHAAVFEVEDPPVLQGETILTLTLSFNNNSGHQIGRFRLSAWEGPEPAAADAGSMPEPAAALLELPPASRTPAQAAALLRWYRALDPEWRRLQEEEREHLKKAPKPAVVKALISSEGLPPLRLHSQGEDFLNETHFLRRGDSDQKDGVAAPGYLQSLMPSFGSEALWRVQPPAGRRTSFRRASLARWITDVDRGAGALLARVIANRVWQFHMGRGIAATPSDFGSRGEKPTHPELLDWLAAELIRSGWRLKALHRLILSSAAYREDGSGETEAERLDPDNRLFGRMARRRLDAEGIRDSILEVSGELDRRMFGPGTLDESSRRRSIYFTVKRSKLISMMQVFDAPEALQGISERPTTTIAPQALLLMNNPGIRAAARGFATRISRGEQGSRDEGAVRSAYRLALGREPRPEEEADAAAFLASQAASHRQSGHAEPGRAALADFCQALFCMNEFVYIE